MRTIETIWTGSTMHDRMSGRTFPAAARKVGVMIAALEWLEAKLERRKGRLALMEMTDDQLKDIGISRAEADGEAYRRIWE